MASHLLLKLIRTCGLKEINQMGQYRKLSISLLKCNKSLDDMKNSKKSELKTSEEVLKSSKEVQHEKAHDGYITVPVEEELGVISGVPEEHRKSRYVRIFQPAKNAMQSGTDNVNHWEMEFETRERWENPLMGWTSTGDPMSNVKVGFASQEEAIKHCKKMGWNYYVQKPNEVKPKSRSYGTNFAWNKRTRVSTK